MEYIFELFLSGLTRGSIYALIALGYTMVYGIIQLINFAHGEIYMIGAFTALIVTSVLTILGWNHIAIIFMASIVAVVYSMAYGDQPALICEMVDWARACGLPVVAAGKGTKYRPEYHASTPDTVWDYYGRSAEEAAVAGMNPQMFNSFLDGTKSALEMAAIANATGLAPPPDGLAFPAAGILRALYCDASRWR